MIYNTGETDEELRTEYNPEGSLLRKAQYRMLDMLDYINEVCKEQGIHYRLDGGTVLGAVRHKGFIPWDDDLDLVLPRKDWKKLIKYLIANPHPQYKIQCHKTDPGYMGGWAVLRDTKSEYVQNSRIHNARKYRGLQIDLFPYDKGNLLCLQYFASRIGGIIDKCITKGNLTLANLVWHISYNFLFPIFRMFNVFGDRTKVSHSYGTWWIDKDKNYFKVTEVIPYSPILFEGKLFPGPSHPEKVLGRIYGDYLSLPDRKNRNVHKARYKVWD